jgi:6-phosphofructokinase 1
MVHEHKKINKHTSNTDNGGRIMADKTIRTIGVLTSGGDAPGMNAAIRAVVRTALGKGLRVRGIRKGYQGLLDEDIIDLTARDVSDTIQRGGTFLQTARCSEMRTKEGQQEAAAICKKYEIDGLVVIGGDGSFAGAQKLSHYGINTVGIPGTIDLDIACTEYTIGFDTAVNTAMEAIDKVRDTSTSHERCSIIEVMGRDAGYLALWCGIANGAERILMPEEHDYDEEKIIADIQECRKRGKKNYIIINAEGIGDSMNMAKRIEEATGMETRATIIGHMQRGGSPSCKDRVYASIMGSMAVDLLMEGKTNRVVGYRHGEFVDFDINEALGMKKELPAYAYEVAKRLAL